MNYSIRRANASDLPAIEALLPRLAEFDVPEHRKPEELWHGDRDMIQAWASDLRADIDVAVAVIRDSIEGVAVISARKELLNGEPSAHLEVLAVSRKAQGSGIGSALIREAESMASAKGALSMSLHVFSVNHRARKLYERHGFDTELLRCYKRL
ncbi:MAG: GNAT family N-acetyltransferase [Granulosicoccus sp.]|nr:GNAT family N-acetyltransferase [Granulosicoccus sp.]